ncbi:MAG TPA: ABC transporter permease [Anaerolineae bacterium]|nr:ABC transporter permease [Anaerolineae bacterium]HNU04479.1 ABC transporter permease [Anaerolineae bacterium]
MTESRPNAAPQGAERSAGATISAFPPRRSFLARFQRWEWMLVGLIALVVLLNSQLSPYFLDARNLSRTSSDFMEIGLMMLPMVFIIITGGIDLSVASNLAMCASFMGWLFMRGVPIWPAALAALLLGALGGLFNGLLVARVKLPPLVVTLGTYAFYRGVAYVLLGDQAARGYPASFTYIGQGKLPGTLIPFSVALFILLAIIFGLVLHRTSFGRTLFAIGNNENATAYSGVPVARIKIIVYTISGLMAGLAGLVLAARFGSTRPDIGVGLELAVITAAVLGGVDINGGIGTMGGAVLSLLLIGLLRFGMGLLNIQGQVQGMVIGLLLILSILLPNVARTLSLRGGSTHQRGRLATAAAVVAVFVLFGLFFFWSRAQVLGAG